MTTDNTHHDSDPQETQTANAGYNDSSEIEPTCGPDWSSIEINCSFTEEQKALIREYTDRTVGLALAEANLEALRKPFEWVYNDGRDDLRGVLIRIILFMKYAVPSLQPLNLTQLGRKFGFKKQSLGRWHHGEFAPDEKPFEGQSLKEAFPFLNINTNETDEAE
jgi:hypothetical protein